VPVKLLCPPPAVGLSASGAVATLPSAPGVWGGVQDVLRCSGIEPAPAIGKIGGAQLTIIAGRSWLAGATADVNPARSVEKSRSGIAAGVPQTRPGQNRHACGRSRNVRFSWPARPAGFMVGGHVKSLNPWSACLLFRAGLLLRSGAALRGTMAGWPGDRRAVLTPWQRKKKCAPQNPSTAQKAQRPPGTRQGTHGGWSGIGTGCGGPPACAGQHPHGRPRQERPHRCGIWSPEGAALASGCG